ncbi:MAG: 16S rRNA processing protein RimM [Desulfovibrionaceae bacterium]|nr:16S rRNA processing protein RimM [Desulfovibrionaceae bacterium]
MSASKAVGRDPGRELLALGKAVKPHGVRGEVCVASYADSPFIYDLLDRVFLRLPDQAVRDLAIESWRPHKGMVLLKLAGVDDRDAAEALRGCELAVRKADLPPAEPGEVYLHELEGCRVLLADGREIGVLRGFILAGGGEVWSIETRDGREVLFPAAPDLVLGLDPGAGEVVVDPPEGLLDIYLAGDTDRGR